MNRLKTMRGFGWADAIGAGMLIAITFAALLGIARPILDESHQRLDHQAQLRRIEQEVTRLEQELKPINQELNRVRTLIDDASIDLRSASQLNQRMARLGDLAIEMGMTIDRMKPGAPIMTPSFVVVPIELGGVGTFSAFASFLDRIHTDLRDTTIPNFEVQEDRHREHGGARFSIELLWHAGSHQIAMEREDD